MMENAVMHIRTGLLAVACILAAALGCAGGGGSGESSTPIVSAPLSASGTIRIMPLGDSITSSLDGEASYRYWLYQQLAASGLSVDFVGSQRGVHRGEPRFPDFDQDHEGHWMWRADEIRLRIGEWMTTYQPEIVLLHIGTNDIFQGQGAASTAEDIRGIVSTILSTDPDTRIVLSLLIPPDRDPARMVELNALLPEIAGSLSTIENPIAVVDQFTGFDPNLDTVDGVHPNASGENKLAAKFHSAILQFIYFE